MRHSIFIIISLFVFACNNQKQTDDSHLQDIDTTISHIDSNVHDHDHSDHDTVNHQPPTNQQPVTSKPPSNPPDSHLIRPGVHDLTLHWISWDHPGKITITPIGDGWYSAKGEQRSRENNDYLIVDGKLKPVSEKELKFVGRIENRVRHNNGGQPCIREGEQTFLSNKGRKYWRLQNMTNCEGGLLVDYIDIFYN